MALCCIATAPAATLLTLREYESKGTVTDTILGVTGFNVCFLLMAGVEVVGYSDLSAREVWLGLGAC